MDALAPANNATTRNNNAQPHHYHLPTTNNNDDPQQLKVFDLANLSLKFDRHLEAEVVDFAILTDDYSKAAFVCADRSVSFHARFGTYFKVRVTTGDE